MRDSYKYFNKAEDKWETIRSHEVEKWQFRAIYANGRELRHYNDDNGIKHGFYDIDQSQLKEFVVESPHFPNKFILKFDPSWMKLVFYYKTYDIFIHTGVDKDGDPAGFRHKERYTVYGYEGNGEKRLQVIDAQGNLYITDDLETITIAKGRKRLSA